MNTKNIIILLCVFLSINAFAQSDQDSTIETSSLEGKKNELKFGALSLLFGPSLHVEYERVQDRFSTFGGRIGINNLNKDLEFSLSPFYRFYFNETKEYGSEGFFVQAFLDYKMGTNYVPVIFNNVIKEEKENYNAFSFGFGLGKKWINAKGFVLQLNGGIGRVLFHNNYGDEFIPQGNVMLGYRF